MNYFKIVDSENELLQALIIRGIVFLEEQKLPFNMEFDHYDKLTSNQVLHILGVEHQEPFAVGRIIFTTDKQVKLERIAIRPAMRGKGLGRKLVQYMLKESIQRGAHQIYIHAQRHLADFYHELGFKAQGDVFIEAGIEHIYMQYTVID